MLYPYNSACLQFSQHRAFPHPNLSRYGTYHTPRNRAGISRQRAHRLDALLWWSCLSLEVASLFNYNTIVYPIIKLQCFSYNFLLSEEHSSNYTYSQRFQLIDVVRIGMTFRDDVIKAYHIHSLNHSLSNSTMLTLRISFSLLRFS